MIIHELRKEKVSRIIPMFLAGCWRCHSQMHVAQEKGQVGGGGGVTYIVYR